VTASIGEGHDLPARLLADAITASDDRAEVAIADGLRAMGRLLTAVAEDGSRAVFFRRQWAYDVTFALSVRFGPTHAVLREALGAVGSRGLGRLVERHRPHVVVSTYPVTTEVLGWMRRRGRLDVPAVAVITDLASLRFWAARGIALHLVTHPESIAEVRRVAGDGTAVRVVRGLVAPDFYEPRSAAAARRALGLPADGGVAVVSGGGWGVGDLDGALELIAGVPGVAVTVCLCGRNEGLRRRLEAAYRGRPGVRVQGFTEHMSEWLAAADVLVHSTAGLTVLEAAMRGCPVISYGWNRGHIRLNNQAFARFGLAAVAHDRQELRAQVARVIAAPRPRPPAADAWPEASAEILALAGARRGSGVAGGPG